MKVILTIIFLTTISTFINGQNTDTIADLTLARRLRVWQDSKKDYTRFIKKQASLRKKLNKYIEKEDLDLLLAMRSTYYNAVEESEEGMNQMAQVTPSMDSLVFLKISEILHDRFRHQIRSHEMLQPLIRPKGELKENAEYLSKKYSTKIATINYKISLAYAKLHFIESNLSLKYRGKEEKTKKEFRHMIKARKAKWDDKTKPYNLHGYTKTLITKSSL